MRLKKSIILQSHKNASRTPAVTMTLPIATGKKIFQPYCISWSNRKRGKVPRNQMKTYSNRNTLPRNHTTPGMRSRNHNHYQLGKGRSHPPRNRITPMAETAIILAYSARKNSENRNPLYSV